MAPKRRKRARSPSPELFEEEVQEPWDEPREVREQMMASAGNELEKQLLGLFAKGVIDAMTLCTICWRAVQAGAVGVGLDLYAKKPDGETGSYKKYLDTVLPTSSVELCNIYVPMWRRGHRVTLPLMVAPVHELLAKEAENDQHAVHGVVDAECADTFHEHPLRRIDGDGRPVAPIALYLDGVRYTRTTLTGKQDTILGITAYNLHTKKAPSGGISEAITVPLWVQRPLHNSTSDDVFKTLPVGSRFGHQTFESV